MGFNKRIELELTDYEILSTGADGGHKYISTEILENGKERRIIVLFKSKKDEALLEQRNTIKVFGNLFDQGSDQGLILNDSEIIQ